MSDTIYDKLNSLKKEVEKRIDQLRKLEKDGKNYIGYIVLMMM